jgi:hypothetical protein
MMIYSIRRRRLRNAIAPYRRIYGYITLAYQHAIPAGTCPEPVFPYIPYPSDGLPSLTYPSGLSPAPPPLSSRRKNTRAGVHLDPPLT